MKRYSTAAAAVDGNNNINNINEGKLPIYPSKRRLSLKNLDSNDMLKRRNSLKNSIDGENPLMKRRSSVKNLGDETNLRRRSMAAISDSNKANKDTIIDISKSQEYSKLCVSIACGLIDCLTTWESLTKMIPELNIETEAKRHEKVDQSVLSSTRALMVKSFISQKVTENSINESDARKVTNTNTNASNKMFNDATHMEISLGSQGITAVAPGLEQVCCRRVTKAVADYLGKNAFVAD
jgi:hypothetical protein